MSDGVATLPLDTLLEGVPFDDYKAIDAINASGLKNILRSPAHFMHEKISPRHDTPALRMGRLIHAAILEADATDFIVSPDYNLRTKQGKIDLAKWRQDLPDGATEVNESEMEQLTGMRAAARAHSILRRVLKRGRSETTLLWRDAAHDNVLCKMRPDYIADDTRILFDLKTTQDARHDAFSRDAYKYGYLLQAGHYTEGLRATGVGNPEQYCIIAIEKTPPYGIRLYALSIDALNLGHQQRTLAMQQYVECLAKDTWPSYPETFEPLEPPPWANSL